MFRPLFFLLLALPLIEIYLLILIGGIIGAGWTIFLCVFTAVLGGILVRRQGFSTLRNVQVTMARGEMPALEMLEGMVLLVCGILLVIPGFFTDALAFLALIPKFRRFLVLWAVKYALTGGKFEVRRYQHGSTYPRRPRVIEGQAKREEEDE